MFLCPDKLFMSRGGFFVFLDCGWLVGEKLDGVDLLLAVCLWWLDCHVIAFFGIVTLLLIRAFNEHDRQGYEQHMKWIFWGISG